MNWLWPVCPEGGSGIGTLVGTVFGVSSRGFSLEVAILSCSGLHRINELVWDNQTSLALSCTMTLAGP